MFTPGQLAEIRDAAAAVVHEFAWKKRPRGRVQYWLPDGREDIPANRLYGQAAQRAARRAQAAGAAAPPPAANPAGPQWTDEDRRDFEMRPDAATPAGTSFDFDILDIEPVAFPEPDASAPADDGPEGATRWGTPELQADWSRHVGTLTPHQVVGAPPGSRATVTRSSAGQLLVDVSHPSLAQCRRLVYAEGGERYVRNLVFEVKGDRQNAGLGAEMFARQVAELSAAGFSHIECYAAGPPYNGYATWPRFGYDQSIDTLDSLQQAKVRAEFPDAKSVLDILATPEGRDWWMGKKGPDGRRTGGNGFSLNRAVFDLRPGSRSMRVMAAYLAEKEAAKKSTSPPSRTTPSTAPGRNSATGDRRFSEVYCYAGWGDWKPDGPGHMKSPGGRRLTNAAYQKLSKGKAPPKPAEPSKPEEKPGLLRRAVSGVADKAAAAYDWAKDRYGPRTAKAIVGAGALGVPIPVPGAVLATAAPVLAVAELNRAIFGGPKKPSPTPPTPVPPKKPAGKPDPALGIAKAKAEVARAAADRARRPGSGEPPDRVAWLEARARKAEDDLRKLGG